MISVSSKYMVQNTQCIIHGPVGKHVFWANSPKYIVQNEPSRWLANLNFSLLKEFLVFNSGGRRDNRMVTYMLSGAYL